MRKFKESQEHIYKRLVANTKTGSILASIRTGKTGPLLVWLWSNRHRFHNILWLCYDTDERDRHLKLECEAWGIGDMFNEMTVYLPDSLHKLEGRRFDVIVWNEMQRVNGRFFNTLKNFIHYDLMIGMTGTYPNNREKKELLAYLGLNRVFCRYDTQQAVKNKNVAPYRITIYEVPLNDQKDVKIDYGGGSFYTSEKEQADYIRKQRVAARHTARDKPLAFKEMRILNNVQSKIDICKKMLFNLKEKRYLVFAGDHKTSQKISKYIFNSKTKDDYFKKFHDEQIPHLVLLNKASTGTTYENLDGCILLAVNGSNVDVLQRILRSILFRPNYVADIRILISKDTIQKKWITKALADLDQSKIEFKDYE
jgi:hypothetical protein